MSRRKPLADDFTDADLKVGSPKDSAAGPSSIGHAMLPILRAVGPRKTLRAALTMNHKDGFDCPSCA